MLHVCLMRVFLFLCKKASTQVPAAEGGRKKVQKKNLAKASTQSQEDSEEEASSEDDQSSIGEAADYDKMKTDGMSVEQCLQYDCPELQALLARKSNIIYSTI